SRRGARAVRVRRAGRSAPERNARMTTMRAPAKINLTLIVGPVRDDGLHEVVTILQRIDLYDTVRLERHGELVVEGFAEDTLVRRALESLAAGAPVQVGLEGAIHQSIP